MSEVIFVTGIDTNIGKTYATAFLKKQLEAEGRRVITQKMIQTGNRHSSEDIEQHRRLLGEELFEVDRLGLTAPIILSYPASPHLAARLDHVEIDLSVLDNATNALHEVYGYDTVLLEGAGGLMVPIREDYLTIDFIQERSYPIALTSCGRLGSLNHTLLSIDVCVRRNLDLRYLVYNQYPSVDPIIEEDSLGFLRSYLVKHSPQTQLLLLPSWT